WKQSAPAARNGNFKPRSRPRGLTDFVAYMSYKPDYRRAEMAMEASFSGKLPNDNLTAYMDVSPVNHFSLEPA
ncbi:MAG: hypothetical protein ACR2NN_00750, partial [Bryobacteraceae bacterium]